MRSKLKALIYRYKTRTKKLREDVLAAGKAENLANYELGRLHELNKVISELRKVYENITYDA